MSMFRTVLRNEEMDRKQLKFTKSTFEWLSDEAQAAVRPVSRGMLIYEMVMMFSEPLSDEISEKEQRVNQRLESHTDTSFRCGVDSIKVRNEDGSYPSQTIIDPDDELTESLIGIYLPVSVQEYLEGEWGQRYWAEKVDDLVIDYIDSAFESRYDRYRCKEELVEYIEDDESPDHEVAQAIIYGDDSRYTVSELHDELVEGKWWLNSELDHGDIMDRIEKEFDSTTPLETKIEVSEVMLDRYAEERGMSISRKLAVALITDAFDVSESYVENEYLPEIELPDYSGEEEEDEQNGVYEDYYEACLKAKNQLVEFLEDEREEEKANKIERMNAPNVCLLEKSDVEELDELTDEDQRVEKIDDIVGKGTYSESFEINQQRQLHDEIIGIIMEEVDN